MTHHNKLIVGSLLAIVLIFTTAGEAPRIVSGPETIPHISPDMLNPEFWIDQLTDPDQPFLTTDQYQQLSAGWIEQDLIVAIDRFPDQLNSFQLKQWLKEDFSYLKRVGRYQADASLLPEEDYNKIIRNVNLESLKESRVSSQWGLLVKPTTMRLLPTDVIITAKPKDVEFDILAHSELRLAEPVVVLHHSSDEQWLFIVSNIGRGWVPKQAVGLAKQKDQVLDYMQQARTVLLESKATLNTDQQEVVVKMGCMLAFHTKEEVRIPGQDKTGHLLFKVAMVMEPQSWSNQFLVPTPRNMISQAFKMLDLSYGWGGSQGIGDCSDLVRRIGLCFGMIWPRSTKALEQGFNATPIKMSQNPDLKSGQTLLTLPGHVMLVIGQLNGTTYVIHNLYGIHGQDKEGPLIKRVARVIVSDLSLGQGSHKGSLKTRVNKKIEFSSF